MNSSRNLPRFQPRFHAKYSKRKDDLPAASCIRESNSLVTEVWHTSKYSDMHFPIDLYRNVASFMACMV